MIWCHGEKGVKIIHRSLFFKNWELPASAQEVTRDIKCIIVYNLYSDMQGLFLKCGEELLTYVLVSRLST